MKVYKPAHTTTWEIWELETDHLKRIGSSGKIVADWDERNGYHGYTYDNEFFRTRDAATKWISKQYVTNDEIINI